MTQTTAVKTVVRQGNSLAVMISKEAKKMGVKEGDKIEVSLSPVGLPQENRFSGLQALRLLMDGHMLKSIGSPIARSPDDVIYAMMDPLGLCGEGQPKTSADIWLAFGEPVGDRPAKTWISRCNDVLALVTAMSWSVESLKDADEMTLNTRAYLAIIQDARNELIKRDIEITEEDVDKMIMRLNDIGWDYDARQNKGVYDADRL